jgi:hypothetical protein
MGAIILMAGPLIGAALMLISLSVRGKGKR